MPRIVMGVVGDLLVNRDRPNEAFSKVRQVLAVPDIVFGNVESAYTDDPRPVPNSIYCLSAPSRNVEVYGEVGFDVVSLANNHILDVGYDAMLQTRDRLTRSGVKTCGAGANIAEAREPAIVEAQGLRVAFLAYASIFPMGYQARADRPGLAPVRAYNYWRDSNPGLYAPGKRPLAMTVPDSGDLAALCEDIKGARERADLIVVSFHWGTMERHRLTDHEIRTARFCIDEGADMIVAHHHHTLRTMEWYKGKPIMYGLGHFVFDQRHDWTPESFDELVRQYDPALHSDNPDFRHVPQKGWPLLPFHPEARMTAFAWAISEDRGIADVGFLPCRLTSDGLVHPFGAGSPEGEEVVSYLDTCGLTQGISSRFTADGAMPIAGFPTYRALPA